jgi:hypothetical protein
MVHPSEDALRAPRILGYGATQRLVPPPAKVQLKGGWHSKLQHG